MGITEGGSMTLSERALSFAIRAHAGQMRKSEKDKPYVIHPIIVGLILKKYGFDDNVVAAGYLHDVVEETDYTIDDIARLFGGDVASLVMTATEVDSSLSWKERKTQQIKATANMPKRNAAIICADKIANVEDLRMERRKNGGVDYSNFRADESEQRWFFESMYNELYKIIDNPIVDRLYNSIIDVFDREYDPEFDYSDDFFRMNRISGYQEDLMKLKTIIGDTKPYIIEFAGTQKSGKTSMMTLAVTLHNIPEGMAVGVALAGAICGNSTITITAAIALSIGIAIQNFPEGAIISMPLKEQGNSKTKSFLYGTLSGIVEPIFGLLTIFLTSIVVPILPYLLSFASGAMIYVVVEELIPESQIGKHSNLGTIGFSIGFIIMMILDVALG